MLWQHYLEYNKPNFFAFILKQASLKSFFDLITETIKILGVHFSYHEKLKTQKNFAKSITNMLNFLNLWRMRNISLEGKIIIFKILALSKTVYLTLITSFSKQLIE